MDTFILVVGWLTVFVTGMILVYVASLLAGSYLTLYCKGYWGAPGHTTFWHSILRSYRFTHAGVESEKTIWGEHPVAKVFGLVAALRGQWFIGAIKFGEFSQFDVKTRLRCDECNGSGVNNADQLWPGRAACRHCSGTGADPDTIPRHANAGRYLAEVNDGTLVYLNHTNEWQACPNFIAADRARINALEAVLCRFADFKNCTAEDVIKARELLGIKLADEGLGYLTVVRTTRRVTTQHCTCVEPIIRCDDKGCNCTVCGQPG